MGWMKQKAEAAKEQARALAEKAKEQAADLTGNAAMSAEQQAAERLARQKAGHSP